MLQNRAEMKSNRLETCSASHEGSMKSKASVDCSVITTYRKVYGIQMNAINSTEFLYQAFITELLLTKFRDFYLPKSHMRV